MRAARAIALCCAAILAGCEPGSKPIDGPSDTGGAALPDAGPGIVLDGGAAPDASSAIDAAIGDAAIGDAAIEDAAPYDAAPLDAAPLDAAPLDAAAVMDASLPADGGAMLDAGRPDASQVDAGSTLPDAGPLSRGLDWVRHNPMFISGLTVVMGAPDAPAAADYFDALHATAAHLWATGLPAEIDGWRSARPGLRWLSWVDQDGNSLSNGQLIGGYPAGAPGRIGYQVGDEPADQTAFDHTVAGVAAIRAIDPGALLVINYAGGGDPTMLERHATEAHADVYSTDDYTRKKTLFGSLGKIRTAGLRHGLPYWRYIRAYTESGQSPELDESDCRWDAFMGVLHGFTGHTWFTYQNAPNGGLLPGMFESPGSFGSAKTPLFQIVAAIDLELAHLGRALTQLTSTEVRYVPGLGFQQPAGTQTWSPGAGGNPFITAVRAGTGSGFLPEIALGFFIDDAGEHYAAALNPRHTHAEFPIDNTGALMLEVDFDFGSHAGVDRTRVWSLDRSSGQVTPLPLTAVAAVSGAAARLAVRIEAGDLILWKYATARPFALGP